MPRKIIYNNCKCGGLKLIQAHTCRKCYILISTSYNKPKGTKTIYYCKCKAIKSKHAKNCLKCATQISTKRAGEKTIQYYYKLYKGGPNAYVHVRVNARAAMDRSGQLKQCKVCNYSKHVEVCHIKPINSFKKSTKLKVVNSLKNMIYLCPNCHWEFDNGYLKKNLLSLLK